MTARKRTIEVDDATAALESHAAIYSRKLSTSDIRLVDQREH
jgi:hypothetical protein